MRNSVLIAVVVLLSSCKNPLASSRTEEEDPVVEPEPSGEPVSAHLVPPYQPMKWDAVERDDVPVIDQPVYFTTASDALLALEGSNELSTEDDRLVLALLKDYASGKAPLQAMHVDIPRFENGSVALMGYSCSRDTYVVPAGMRMPAAQFIAAFYHEALHAAYCRPLREKAGAKPGEYAPSLENAMASTCLVEYRAHAAGIRAFLALQARNGLPVYLSSQDPRGMFVVNAIMEAWPVLSENRFCEWYGNKFPQFR